MSQTETTILVPPSPQTPDDPIFLRDGFFIAVLAVRLCSLLDRPRVRRPRHLRPSRGRAGVRGHIPTQRNRRIACSVDPVRYRRHNRVELFFNKLNHFRRIATSFEKLARDFLGAVRIASTRHRARTYRSTTSALPASKMCD